MMEDPKSYYGNPWLDDDRSLGSLRNALLLAERHGYLKQDNQPYYLNEDEVLRVARKTPSLQMIETLKDIQEKRSQIHETSLSIQHHQQERETRDITQSSILEKHVAELGDMNNHLQKVTQNKDNLITRLQQPFVGDFIKLDAHYHTYAAETIPTLVPILADLTKQLDNIDWTSKNLWNDGSLENLLSELATNLAGLQSSFLSMLRLRSSIQQLHIYRSNSHDVSVPHDHLEDEIYD